MQTRFAVIVRSLQAIRPNRSERFGQLSCDFISRQYGNDNKIIFSSTLRETVFNRNVKMIIRENVNGSVICKKAFLRIVYKGSLTFFYSESNVRSASESRDKIVFGDTWIENSIEN